MKKNKQTNKKKTHKKNNIATMKEICIYIKKQKNFSVYPSN